MTHKRYEELNFTDDFMFCKIITNHLELAKELLEILLLIPIGEDRLSERLRNFLGYIKDHVPRDPFTRRLQAEACISRLPEAG